MFNETIVPNEQQNCFIFPKDWYGKMNVQIIATPIPEKQHEDDPEELQRRQAFRQHMNELHRKAREAIIPEEQKAMEQDDPVARKLAQLNWWRFQPKFIASPQLMQLRQFRIESGAYEPDYYKHYPYSGDGTEDREGDYQAFVATLTDEQRQKLLPQIEKFNEIRKEKASMK
jgi:hypothetical protein